MTLAAAILFVNLAGSVVTAQTIASSEYRSAESAAWGTLTHGLKDNDPANRMKALAAVGTLGDRPDAIQRVQDALQDKDPQVRQAAATTLGEMGSPDAIPALEAALDDGPEVSFAAAKALWKLGDWRGRWIFQQLLAGQRTDTPGALEGALRDAKRKLRNPSQLALMGVKEASGQFLGPASISIDLAREAMKDSGAPGRAAAAELLATDPEPYALTLLEWALADKSWTVRAAVAKALGQRGTPQDIPKLLPLLADDHHLVKFMAAASILKLSAPAGPKLSAKPVG